MSTCGAIGRRGCFKSSFFWVRVSAGAHAPIAQLVDAWGLSPQLCQFESDWEYTTGICKNT